MSTQDVYVGRFERNVTDVAAEYQMLAQEDEKIGRLLIDQGHYRHGVYFLVQAMEKYVRSTIFGLVNPHVPYFRQKTQTHNLDELLAFLREILCSDEEFRKLLHHQMDDSVLGGIKFGELHNNLRYPRFNDRHCSYSVLKVNHEDAKIVFARLQALKQFLKDSHQMRR